MCEFTFGHLLAPFVPMPLCYCLAHQVLGGIPKGGRPWAGGVGDVPPTNKIFFSLLSRGGGGADRSRGRSSGGNSSPAECTV